MARDLTLTFRALKARPPEWRDASLPRSNPFRVTWGETLQDLDYELERIDATDVFLQVDAPEGSVRLNGELKGNAIVRHPGVILTVEAPVHGVLVLATDVYSTWKANVRGCGLTLKALRDVDRHGATGRGQQYAGFRELADGQSPGQIGPGLTRRGAAELLADALFGNLDEASIARVLDDPAAAYRSAAKRHHPDVGGDDETFARLSEAVARLEREG